MPGTGFSQAEKSLLDNQISLNLHFPMMRADCYSCCYCYLNDVHLLGETPEQIYWRGMGRQRGGTAVCEIF